VEPLERVDKTTIEEAFTAARTTARSYNSAWAIRCDVASRLAAVQEAWTKACRDVDVAEVAAVRALDTLQALVAKLI